MHSQLPSSDDVIRAPKSRMLFFSEREWQVYVKIKTLAQLVQVRSGRSRFAADDLDDIVDGWLGVPGSLVVLKDPVLVANCV